MESPRWVARRHVVGISRHPCRTDSLDIQVQRVDLLRFPLVINIRVDLGVLGRAIQRDYQRHWLPRITVRPFRLTLECPVRYSFHAHELGVTNGEIGVEPLHGPLLVLRYAFHAHGQRP